MIRIQIVTEKWNPVSAAIRYGTRSWASHAEFVYMENDKPIETLGSRAKGGVRCRFSRKDHYTRVEQFVLNSATSESLIESAYNWAYGQRGKSYDFSAIMGIASDRDWHDEKRWFCSELVAVAFEKIGFPLLSTRPSDMPWRITPRDLLLSRQLVFVGGYGV